MAVIGELPQGADQAEPVQHRHVDVRDHQGEVLGLGQGQGGGPILGAAHLETGGTQGQRQHFTQGAGIIDREDVIHGSGGPCGGDRRVYSLSSPRPLAGNSNNCRHGGDDGRSPSVRRNGAGAGTRHRCGLRGRGVIFPALTWVNFGGSFQR
jgi:hypothetical protein